ncbi:MAG TPA: PIG-L family deacetylase [Acidimicrobiales bacterium]|nr:PIG-L family deacetylase [Acidimicrobiales bacterium]
MDQPLRLLTVHAHPDDEASKGAGTVARYADEGIEATLVCCTGGEAGDVLNPALDTPEVRADIGAVRRAELQRSVDIIGYARWDMLGYRDSGMPDSEHNAHPDCFARAPLDEAVGRLVALIRRDRPQVLVSYGEEQSGYPHPDHLRAHEITLAAWHAAGDPERFPEAGTRFLALHQAFLDHGLESPFDDAWFARPSHDHLITTRIDVERYYHVRADALRAHATQVDPTSPFWFGLPDDVAAKIYPWDDYELADTRVPVTGDGVEDDLFHGLRAPVSS